MSTPRKKLENLLPDIAMTGLLGLGGLATYLLCRNKVNDDPTGYSDTDLARMAIRAAKQVSSKTERVLGAQNRLIEAVTGLIEQQDEVERFEVEMRRRDEVRRKEAASGVSLHMNRNGDAFTFTGGGVSVEGDDPSAAIEAWCCRVAESSASNPSAEKALRALGLAVDDEETTDVTS